MTWSEEAETDDVARSFVTPHESSTVVKSFREVEFHQKRELCQASSRPTMKEHLIENAGLAELPQLPYRDFDNLDRFRFRSPGLTS